ncbi:MAG: DUF4282 domain-containing protein [Thermoguttaceae bacterium]
MSNVPQNQQAYQNPQTGNQNFTVNTSAAQPSAGLFDFGFTRFITNTWISVIWTIEVFVVLFSYAISILVGLYLLTQSPLQGIIFLLLATVGVIVGLILSRIWLELMIIVFRIETHLRTIRDQSIK